MRLLTLFLFLYLFLICSCSENRFSNPTIVKEISIGKVRSSRSATTNWNDSNRQEVTCDSMVVFLLGVHSIKLGKDAKYRTWSNGAAYLVIDGEQYFAF